MEEGLALTLAVAIHSSFRRALLSQMGHHPERTGMAAVGLLAGGEQPEPAKFSFASAGRGHYLPSTLAHGRTAHTKFQHHCSH